MSQLKDILIPIIAEKGISERTVDSFVLWYLNKDNKEGRDVRFGKLLVSNLTDDYLAHNWKTKFTVLRYSSKFLNLGGTEDIDKLEELIQQEIDERDRRNSEDY